MRTRDVSDQWPTAVGSDVLSCKAIVWFFVDYHVHRMLDLVMRRTCALCNARAPMLGPPGAGRNLHVMWMHGILRCPWRSTIGAVPNMPTVPIKQPGSPLGKCYQGRVTPGHGIESPHLVAGIK